MSKTLNDLLTKRHPNDADIEIIQPFFDSAYYLSAWGQADTTDIDPIAHYVSVGWREGRDPCAWFSSRWYLKRYPDVEKSGMNPFVHYIRAGWMEKRAIVGADAASDDATADTSYHPLRSIDGKGYRGTLELRGRHGDRFAYISGWALADTGLPMRVGMARSLSGVECFRFSQSRPDVGAARADTGFHTFAVGNLTGERLALELEEARLETPLRVEVVADLPELKVDALIRYLTHIALTCEPVDERSLPATVRELARLRATVDGHTVDRVLARLDAGLPKRKALKVILIARTHPHAAYLNIVLLTSRLKMKADFVVVGLGAVAHQAVTSSLQGFAVSPEHTLTLVEGPVEGASGPIMRHALMLAARQASPALCVLDDVSIAPALDEIEQAANACAVNLGEPEAHAWSLQTRWPESLVDAAPPSSSGAYRQPFWTKARPVGVLLANAAATQPLAHGRAHPYPGRGWALSELASTAVKARIGQARVVDHRAPVADEDALCTLYATHLEQEQSLRAGDA